MWRNCKKTLSFKSTRGALPYDGPLAEFGVKWLGDHAAAEAALRDCLQTATTELPVQKVLEKHPVLLARALGGGHGRWVIPQRRLGAEHVPDFVIGTKSSLGNEWTLVELESPSQRMFKGNGDPSPELTHAIRQIVDWRSWLTANLDYARRSGDSHGLGLDNIDPNSPGLILLGRRGLGEATRDRRRQLGQQLNIRIHSIDWLFNNGEALFFPDAGRQTHANRQ
jgi:Domain of unknown function (DUF4263)